MKMEGRNKGHGLMGAKPTSSMSGGIRPATPATPRPQGPRHATPRAQGPRSTSTMVQPTDPFGRPLAAPDYNYHPGMASRPMVPHTQNININCKGGGLLGAIVGSATSVAVGAIANKMETDRQEKIIEQQGKQQALIEQQRAQNAMLYRQQQNEYNIEMEKLEVQKEEIKLDALQDKRYHANCPYCLAANPSGNKFCEFCGMSLAYYNEKPDDGNNQ